MDLRVGAVLILDDVLITSSDLNPATAKVRRESYLETLIFVRQLAVESSHHLGVSFILTQQTPLTNSGNAYISDCVKTLRQNIDTFLVFSLQNKEMRNLLMSVSSGEQYQRLKHIFLRATDDGIEESPNDIRQKRPYICFSLNPRTVDRTLRFR